MAVIHFNRGSFRSSECVAGVLQLPPPPERALSHLSPDPPVALVFAPHSILLPIDSFLFFLFHLCLLPLHFQDPPWRQPPSANLGRFSTLCWNCADTITVPKGVKRRTGGTEVATLQRLHFLTSSVLCLVSLCTRYTVTIAFPSESFKKANCNHGTCRCSTLYSVAIAIRR